MSNEEIPEFAQRLQDLVSRSGLTQSEISKRAGMTRDAFNRYFLGKTKPPARRAVQIARALSCKPSDIDESYMKLDNIEHEVQAASYDMSPPKSGDPSKIHIKIDAEISIQSAMQIVSILNKDM